MLAASMLVVKTAVPLESAAIPRDVVPSRKAMLPVGMPPMEEILAVRVTVAPAGAGFGDAVSIRLVAAGGAGLTTRETAAEVLAANEELPA